MGDGHAHGEVLLAVENVVVTFGGVRAVDGVSLDFGMRGITGIVGPNGAGKSTLFDVLAGARTPRSGVVRWQGRDVTRAPLHGRAHAGLARSFQIARELDSLTVMENLLLASPGHPGDALWRVLFTPGAVRDAEAALRERAWALLERVRLAPLADRYAGELSGGQKKLLELARALMLSPRLVLLDEPAAGVAPGLVEVLTEFILGLKAQGTAFVVVEHNMDFVASLCDRVCVLADGALLTEGTFAQVTADERVMRAYLGHAA